MKLFQMIETARQELLDNLDVIENSCKETIAERKEFMEYLEEKVANGESKSTQEDQDWHQSLQLQDHGITIMTDAAEKQSNAIDDAENYLLHSAWFVEDQTNEIGAMAYHAIVRSNPHLTREQRYMIMEELMERSQAWSNRVLVDLVGANAADDMRLAIANADDFDFED